MSFACQACGTPQTTGTKPNKVVTKQRRKVYPVRYTPDGKRIIDNGGMGIETAEELNLCDKCAKKVGEPELIAG